MFTTRRTTYGSVYPRDLLLSLRSTSTVPSTVTIDRITQLSLLRCRRRGCRAGRRRHRPDPVLHPVGNGVAIITGNRPQCCIRLRRTPVIYRVNRANPAASASTILNATSSSGLSIYVLNAAGLSKQHAVDHLAADLSSYGTDVAVVTETHLRAKHSDNIVSLPGYTLFRRDRCTRNASGRLMIGGGVAVYVRSTLQFDVWKYSSDDPTYELLWVRSRGLFIAALYHPPRPQYQSQSLVNYVDGCMQEIQHDFPTAVVVIAGDFNKLSESSIVAVTGLTPIVRQPTRGANVLDQIYVSDPWVFDAVRVVKSVVKSDHLAVVAYTERDNISLINQSTRAHYRRVTPGQHAAFLQHVRGLDFTSSFPDTVQAALNHFYNVAYGLLDQFYPERTITVRSRDPEYITPYVKSLLRKKNSLMRAGRVEKAGAIARRVGKEITKHNRTRLQKYNGRADAKDMWAAVRQLTGRHQAPLIPNGIDADCLNRHYANISTDKEYVQPPVKSTAVPDWTYSWISEYRMFRVLDSLKPTATGLDGLPVWFLRLGAPVFSKTLADFVNLSLSTSTVPAKWKKARICPVPKTIRPALPSDFRPISVTDVLSRIMEKMIVRDFLYPALLSPPPTLSFTDQYAFRPSGSTTAALVALLHCVTRALETNPYVVVVALDFSKAFDTVRHNSVMSKVAQLNVPDNVYNWLANYLHGHSHCTRYNNHTSDMREVNASIIQGSGIGPVMYVVSAADLHTVTPGNSLVKYADDTYLVIPALNVDTRDIEIANIDTWSQANNLTLNRAKSAEIVFRDNRKRRCIQQPPPLRDVVRVTSLKVLGVTFTDTLSVTAHVDDVTSSCARSTYAISVLRSHGMVVTALQQVFQSVVISRLTYAAPAWWGFMTSADRQRIEAILRRAVRADLWPSAATSDPPTFDYLCSSADEELFNKIVTNSNHILHALLPPPSHASQKYNLRHRTYSLQLPDHPTYLSDCNFITRMMYKNCY